MGIPRKTLEKDAGLGAIVPDIFEPMVLSKQREKEQGVQDSGKEKTLRPASLQLKGTIVGGGDPIAIINGEFVRTGDTVGGCKVVRIGKKSVILDMGHEKMQLEIMKDE
jgi:hypothetical protein